MKNKINLLITSALMLFSNVLYCNSINQEITDQNFRMFFSCGTENFENIPTSSSSFETNSWVNNNITWTASDSRTDQTINSKAIVIRNGSLASSITTGGIKSLTVTTQLKFAGNPGNLILEINDIQVGTIPFNSGIVTTTIDNINIAGNIIIKLVNPNTGQRVAIDDLSWSCYSNLGISEIDKVAQLSIYPNPIKNGEYLYLNKKVNEVLIYNSEGKLIKKSNLRSNSILIDNLLKGMYFLKEENTTHKFIVN
ncbi:T9SS type A sorting domain-containing protein [Chryseobacterium capnotolerans]|uniref:T9SS type A sorting domain-containing protein n=1 Tax=Chryseobacterium TaxID=59732 RepID=UPI00083AA68C|nr:MULTISPECIES: T9SS type A sorting domain-containing protein [Chryseobacterium]UHO37108.1 T9SS type A sorting domain-containing protein [Chryseobacterium capnotolerans]